MTQLDIIAINRFLRHLAGPPLQTVTSLSLKRRTNDHKLEARMRRIKILSLLIFLGLGACTKSTPSGAAGSASLPTSQTSAAPHMKIYRGISSISGN